MKMELLKAAERVIACWGKGDLAEAVRNLDKCCQGIRRRVTAEEPSKRKTIKEEKGHEIFSRFLSVSLTQEEWDRAGEAGVDKLIVIVEREFERFIRDLDGTIVATLR